MAKGAYTSTSIYTADDVAAISAYAIDRGVRLLVEIDVPGHAASWQAGHPDLMADCIAKYTNVNNYALNPTLTETYTVVESILSDVAKYAQATYLHLGGDEVVYGCWSNDASITSWMAKNNVTTYDQLLAYFVLKADAIARSLGTTPIHWEEVFLANVPVDPSTIFEVWTNSDRISAVTQAGFKVIAAPSNYWYLDALSTTWTTMYTYDPTANLTATQKNFIIGGEVAMWGEYIDDLNFESVVYPRAFAVGERLWSAQSVNDATAAKPRLLDQRCRFTQRGYRSAPVEPGYCSKTFV